jgi:hypothetical protein
MYELFLEFRDQGRSRTVLDGWKWYADNGGEAKKNSYYVYAKTFDWRDRAKLWDQYEEAQYQLARAERRRDMAERHEGKLEEAIVALVVPIDALNKRIENDDDFMAELSTTSASKLIDMANRAARALPSIMTAERLARGEATEIVVGQIDVTHSIVIERDQVAEILGVLDAAGAFLDGSAVDESLEIVDAEVVDVYPVPADDNDGSEGTGDLDSSDGVSDSPGT